MNKIWLEFDSPGLILILQFSLIFALLVMVGPPALRERVVGAFTPEASQGLKQVGPITLGPSPAARVESWAYMFKYRIPKKPVFGFGVTGIQFLDGQYILTLTETGIVGLFLFIWLMWRIWRAALYSYRTVENPMYKGLVMGYMVGFVGLLFHAIGSNTFIIIRIAEPFWFFTAIVVKLVDIETGKAVLEDLKPRH